jgi:hypothetical protein
MPANHAPPYADIRSRSAVMSAIEQTPKSRLSKVDSSSVLTVHSAAREINYNDTEAGEATQARR